MHQPDLAHLLLSVYSVFAPVVFWGAKGAGIQEFLHSAVFRLLRFGKCPNPAIFYRGAGTILFRNQEFRKFRRSTCYYIDKDVPILPCNTGITYNYHLCYSSLIQINMIISLLKAIFIYCSMNCYWSIVIRTIVVDCRVKYSLLTAPHQLTPFAPPSSLTYNRYHTPPEPHPRCIERQAQAIHLHSPTACFPSNCIWMKICRWLI